VAAKKGLAAKKVVGDWFLVLGKNIAAIAIAKMGLRAKGGIVVGVGWGHWFLVISDWFPENTGKICKILQFLQILHRNFVQFVNQPHPHSWLTTAASSVSHSPSPYTRRGTVAAMAMAKRI